jgi:uncharacterized protein YfaT (DUF1175 family)
MTTQHPTGTDHFAMIRTNRTRRLHSNNKPADWRIRWCCGLLRCAQERIRANETAANRRNGLVATVETYAKPTQPATVALSVTEP